MENYIKTLASLPITKLGQHLIILGYFWMNKHKVLLDIINNSITFFLRFYIHLETSLSLILSKSIEEIKKIFKAKQQEDIISNRILKKSFVKNLDSFLKTIKKIVKKKNQLANAFKQKSNIGKENFLIVIINIFSNLGKEELPISILSPIFGKDIEDISIIGADAYCLACQLKGA